MQAPSTSRAGRATDDGGGPLTIETDLGGGARGWLVIDTTVAEGSAGGLRVADDLTLEEVAVLAREMTLKFSWAGRRTGGAKGGLRVPPGADRAEKRRLLRAFGRRLGPLLRRGVYYAGTDIDCDRTDLAELYAGAGIPFPAPTDTALFTAIGARDVLASCRDALGAPARPLRLAIEGFGAVAAHLCDRLPPERFRVTALSTVRGAVLNERGFDSRQLAESRRRFGDALVERLDGVRGDRQTLFTADVDVLVPSARAWSLTTERARTLRARLVAPVSNAPYDAGAVAVLEARGVVCLAGFSSNCGGVLLSSLHDLGVPLADVERLSARLRAITRALLGARASTGVSAVRIAEDVALARLAAREARTVPESPYRRAARVLASEWTPRWVVAPRALRSARQSLLDLEDRILRYAPGPAIVPLETGSARG